MKRWLLVMMALFLLTGCSASKLWKWLDKQEWEREDQTVRIVDFILR
jgi:uncharacterized protein YcfL